MTPAQTVMTFGSAFSGIGGLMAIVAGCFISFRLLVRGENWVQPDWLNIPLLLVAFLLAAAVGLPLEGYSMAAH